MRAPGIAEDEVENLERDDGALLLGQGSERGGPGEIRERRIGHGQLREILVPGRRVQIFAEEGLEIEAAPRESIGEADPRADDEARAFKRQARIAGIADARDAHAGAVRIARAGAEIEVAPGEHFERAGAADLDVPGERDFLRVELIAGRLRRGAKLGIGVVGDDVARGGDDGDIVHIDVLHVDRDVRDVASGEDARGFAGEKREPGDVTRAGIKMDGIRVAEMEQAGVVQRQLGLQDGGIAGRRAGFREELVDGVEKSRAGQAREGGGADDDLIGLRCGEPRDIRRVGVGEIDAAGAPCADSHTRDRGSAVFLQAIDGSRGSEIHRARRRGRKRDPTDEIDVAGECRGAQRRGHDREQRGEMGGDVRFVEPQPGLKIGDAVVGVREIQQADFRQPTAEQRNRPRTGRRAGPQRHSAAERGDIDRVVRRIGREIGLVPEGVVVAAGEEERIGHRPEQEVARGGHMVAAFAEEKGRGQPVFLGQIFIRRLEVLEGRRAREIRFDLIAGGERALAAFDVIDAAINVPPGLHAKVAAAEFHELAGVRCASWHAGIGGHEAVEVADIASGEEGHVAAAERAHALEEIAEIGPPACGGEFTIVGDAKLAGGGIDKAAPVEPVDGQFLRRIRHEHPCGVLRLVDEIVLRGDGDAPAGETVLRRVAGVLLNGAEGLRATAGVEDRQVESAARQHRGIGDARARGVDRGELVEQFYVAPGGDVDLAGARADDLKTRGHRRARQGIDASREDIRAVIFPQQDGAEIRAETGERAHLMEIHGAEIRAGNHAVAVGLGVRREQRIGREQFRVVGARRETVAERVEENEIAARAQREHAGHAVWPEARGGKIPVARGRGGQSAERQVPRRGRDARRADRRERTREQRDGNRAAGAGGKPHIARAVELHRAAGGERRVRVRRERRDHARRGSDRARYRRTDAVVARRAAGEKHAAARGERHRAGAARVQRDRAAATGDSARRAGGARGETRAGLQGDRDRAAAAAGKFHRARARQRERAAGGESRGRVRRERGDDSTRGGDRARERGGDRVVARRARREKDGAAHARQDDGAGAARREREIQRGRRCRVNHLRTRHDADHRHEPGVVGKKRPRHRCGVAREKRAVVLDAALHVHGAAQNDSALRLRHRARAGDDPAGEREVENLIALHHDARRAEDRPVDRLDLHAGVARGLRRAQVQRAGEIAERLRGGGLRRGVGGVRADHAGDGQVDGRARLHIDKSRRAGRAISLRPSLERNRAAFPRAAEIRRRHRQLRARLQRDAATRDEIDRAAGRAGRVDAAGTRHGDRALVRGEVESVRRRQPVDQHISAAHADGARLVEGGGIENRIRRSRARQAADIERESAALPARAPLAEEHAVECESACLRANGEAARISASGLRGDLDHAECAERHRARFRNHIDLPAVGVLRQVIKSLRGAADIELARRDVAHHHIARRRAERERAARQADEAVVRDACPRQAQARAEPAGERGRATRRSVYDQRAACGDRLIRRLRAGDDRSRNRQRALGREPARAFGDEPARRVHFQIRKLLDAQGAGPEPDGARMERQCPVRRSDRTRRGAVRGVVEDDLRRVETHGAAAGVEAADFRRVQRKFSRRAERAAAEKIDRRIARQAQRLRRLQALERRAGEHQPRDLRHRAGRVEFEADLAAVQRDRLPEQAGRRIEARAVRRIQNHARARHPRVRANGHHRHRGNGDAATRDARRRIAGNAQQQPVAAARDCGTAQHQRGVRAERGAILLDLRAGRKCERFVRDENHIRRGERRAGVVHGQVAGLDDDRRRVRSRLADAADQNAVRAETAERRRIEHDAAGHRRRARPRDENIERAAHIHESAAPARRAACEHRTLERHALRRGENEPPRIDREPRHRDAERARAFAQKGVRREVVVLRARPDGRGGRNFKPRGQSRHRARGAEVVEAIAGNVGRAFRQELRAERQARLRRDEKRAGQQRVARGQQRVVARREARARAEMHAVADGERGVHVAGVAAEIAGRGADVEGRERRVIFRIAGDDREARGGREKVARAAFARDETVGVKVAAAAQVDLRAGLHGHVRAAEDDRFHRQSACGDVRARGVDPRGAIEIEAVGDEQRAARRRVKARDRRDAARRERELLRDRHGCLRDRVHRRRARAVPAERDAAERRAQRAALRDRGTVHIELPARRERYGARARTEDRDRAAVRRAVENVVRGRDGKRHPRRRINLARAQRDRAGHRERSVAANLAAVGDEIRLAEAAQREIADVDEARDNREPAGAKDGRDGKSRARERERRIGLQWPNRCLESLAERDVWSGQADGGVAENNPAIRDRKTAPRIDRHRPGELHGAFQRERIKSPLDEVLRRKIAESRERVATAVAHGIANRGLTRRVERGRNRAPALRYAERGVERRRVEAAGRNENPRADDEIAAERGRAAGAAEQRGVSEKLLVTEQREGAAIAFHAQRGDARTGERCAHGRREFAAIRVVQRQPVARDRAAVGGRKLEDIMRARDIEHRAGFGDDVAADFDRSAIEHRARAVPARVGRQHRRAGGGEKTVRPQIDIRLRCAGLIEQQDRPRIFPADRDCATRRDDRAEHGGGVAADRHAAARVGANRRALAHHKIAAREEQRGDVGVRDAWRGEAQADRRARAWRQQRGRERDISGGRRGDPRLCDGLDDRARRNDHRRQIFSGVCARRSKARERETAEPTLAEKIRLEQQYIRSARDAADLNLRRENAQQAAGAAGESAQRRAEREPPAEHGFDVQILPRADRDAAAFAVGPFAAHAQRHAARHVDHAACGEVGVVAADGDRAAVDRAFSVERHQRQKEPRGRIRAVVHHEPGGAQRGRGAERESAAHRGWRRRGLNGEQVVERRLREIENLETHRAAGRGDAALDVDVRALQFDRAARRSGERDLRRDADAAVAVVDHEVAKSARAHEVGGEEYFRQPLRAQRQRLSGEIECERIGGDQPAAAVEDNARRSRRVAEEGRCGILRLKREGQGARQRRARALPRPGDGQPEQFAVERHGRRGDGDGAAVCALHVTRLVMRAGQVERMGEGFGEAVLRKVPRERARVDARIDTIRRGLRDVPEPPVREQPRGLHEAAVVVRPAAGHVDFRAALHDHGTAGGELHRAARGGQFRRGALDEAGKSGGVSERRADPAEAVIHAGFSHIDAQRHAAHRSRALQRRVRQLAAAQLHGEDVFRQRRGDIRRAGDIDRRARIEVNLAPGVDESRLSGIAGQVAPKSRAERHAGIRREHRGVRREMHGLALQVDLRKQRQRRADDDVRGGKVGQNPGHAARPERNRAGGARQKKKRAEIAHAAIGAAVGGVALEVARRVVIREQVDPPVEGNRRAAVDHAELLDGATRHHHARVRRVDEAVIGRRARGRRIGERGIGDRADVGIEPAQARVAAGMRGQADLLPGGENGLAVGRGDGARVAHVRADERNASADMIGRRRTRQRRAFLHDDIAAQPVRRERGGGREGRRALAPGGDGQRGEKELRIGIVEQAAGDEVVIDRQRGGGERVQIDLRAAAENDAVLVDDIDLPIGLHRAEDLRRRAGRIVDFVEGNPLPRVRAARALVEAQRGLFADVESLPRQQRLLRLLLHEHRGAPACGALRGQRRALPELRVFARLRAREIRGHAWRELESSGRETIRHVRQLQAGVIRIGSEIVRPAERRRARRVLHRLHVPHRLSGSRERIAGIAARLRRGHGSGPKSRAAARPHDPAPAQNIRRARAAARGQREANTQRRRKPERTRARSAVGTALRAVRGERSEAAGGLCAAVRNARRLADARPADGTECRPYQASPVRHAVLFNA